jgi:autotransporter-associated beta strand protein
MRIYEFLILLVLPLLFASLARASDDQDDWSLGPIGGTFRVQPGTGFLRVQSMPTGTPGHAAGLVPGDMIHAAFGESFGTTLTNVTSGGYKGAVQDLAGAIDFAEDSDGILPLKVLRPGVAGFTAAVQLPAVGAFGAAYPRGCPKYAALYEAGVAGIHSLVNASATPNFTNNNGRFGLVLLSHPDWNSTSGSRPYRNSINKLRDRVITVINNSILQPVKPGQPGHVDPGLENWELSACVMFLAEYVNRTGDTSSTVMTALQRGVHCLENRIQTGGTTGDGHMGHGGVTGDYGNWALNIINVYTHAAFAMAKRAGIQPDQTKWNISWDYLKRSTARSDGHIEDGYVDYGAPAWGQGSGWDAAARTAGSLFAFSNYGLPPTADDADALARMKGYMARNYHRMQHAHAYTAGGVLFSQLALPYLPERDQRYVMENTRYFYQFHRTTGSALQYFGGRLNNGGDSYLNFDRVKLYNVAMAGAVANRGLPSIPAENANRLFLRFRAPLLKWPRPEARAGVVSGNNTSFSVQVTDANGATLTPADYTAQWTHVSGPGTASFSNPSSANTTATFSSGGRHRVQLTVTRGAHTLVEPVDLDVLINGPPAGYSTGQAQYQVYTGITGTSVANLTSNAKYPNQPDITTTVTRLEGTYSGDSYGARIRGFIIPPATGAYRFYIASDDASQFRFGTSEAAATVICSVSGWTSPYNWAANASQTSAIQNLTAGTPYFFEALHKEAAGAEHVAVAWTGPGWTQPEVIEGRYLATQGTGPPEIISQPQPRTVASGGATTFNVQTTGAGPFLFQWRRNGVAHWPASTNSQLPLSNIGAGAAGQYDCIITTPGGSITSAPAALTVTGTGGQLAGGLWRDFFSGINGLSVADLTNATTYPNFPSSGGLITSAESPADVADNYGQRWTGWITPDTTGNHRFFIASDDASELWLSTGEQAANRVRIAWVNGWTSARAWSSGGQSAWIPMTAGNRYYIEVRHKEAGSADHCAVAWQRPGEAQPANGSAPIPGQYLSTLQGGVFPDMAASLNLINPSTSSIHIPQNVGLWLVATAQPQAANAIISWQKTAGPGNAAFTDPAALSTGVTFDAPGTYELRLSYDNGNLPSWMTVTVNVATATTTWSPTLHHYGDGSGSVQTSGTSVSLTGSAPGSIRSAQKTDGLSLYGQMFDGDFDLAARIASAADISGTTNERVGIAIRQGSGTTGDEIAAFVGNNSTPTESLFWIRRTSTNGNNTSTTVSTSASLPRWVRLTRVNGVVTGYDSTNGTTWTPVSSNTITLSGPARAGIAWATHSTSTGTATFDNLSLAGAAANTGPMVNAGPPQDINTGGTAALSGSATDDGAVQPLTFTWSRGSGPGVVSFADPSSPVTSATFSASGTYVLRLAASDGEITTYAETTVNVTTAPPRWINPTGGSWNTSANWSGGTIVSGSDALADFSTLTLPSPATVMLDGARVTGLLRTADLSDNHGWTFITGTGGPLTLSTSSGSPQIDIVSQSLTLQAVLAGNQGFVKTGTGLLRIETAGTWTGTTTLAGGTLEVLAKTNDVPYVVQSGTTLRLGYNTGGGYAQTNLKIHGSGADASHGLYLRGGASYNASGQIQLLDAPTTIRHYGTGLASLGTFDINGNGLRVTSAASGSQLDANIQLISRGYGMSVEVLEGDATATGDLVINGQLNVGNLGFYKRGGGSVRLNATATTANTAINLQGGRVIAGALNALGSNSILRVASGTTLLLNGFSQTVRQIEQNGTIVNGAAAHATLTLSPTVDATFSGPLGGTGSHANNFAIQKAGPATLTLSGASSYLGDTTIDAGTLVVHGASLADSSAVRITTGATLHLPHGQADTVAQLWLDGVQQAAGTYDSSSSTFITGTGRLVVTEGHSPFEAWLATAGITPGDPGTGLLESLDGSGVPNLIQFALGGDPANPANNGIKLAFNSPDGGDGAPMVLTIAARDGAVFAGSPTPTASADGITYFIEGSHNLGAWSALVEEVTPAFSSNGTVTAPPGYELHSFRLAPPPNTNSSGYLRVRVSWQPAP